MFEDIFGDIYKRIGKDTRRRKRKEKRRMPVNLHDYRTDPRCIKCGSIDFYIYDGYLSSGSTYTEKVKCNDCDAVWYVTVDRNLKIIKVEKKK